MPARKQGRPKLKVGGRSKKTPARRSRRIRLPIVRSKEPGTLRLSNEQIYGIIPFP